MNQHVQYLFIFIITGIPYRVIAMEPVARKPIFTEITTGKQAFTRLIETTHIAINKECSKSKKISLEKKSRVQPHELSEKRLFKIFEITDTYNSNMNSSFIKALIKKNTFFREAINYFRILAGKNVELVTSNTLDIINDSLAQQPIKQLNKLPLSIKAYVMAVEHKDIVFLYNIVFEGHTDIIESIDINKVANIAASASKDGTFRLWQFDNGKELHIFKEKANSGYVRFNPDGSQLATATIYHHNPKKTRIIIWDTHSKKQLYGITKNHSITWIDFATNEDETILTIGRSSDLSLYKIQKNNKPHLFKIIKKGVITEKYGLINAKQNNSHSWYITANSPQLAICIRALHNSANEESLAGIISTSTYQKLSPHEQDIFNAHLAQKLQLYMK